MRQLSGFAYVSKSSSTGITSESSQSLRRETAEETLLADSCWFSTKFTFLSINPGRPKALLMASGKRHSTTQWLGKMLPADGSQHCDRMTQRQELRGRNGSDRVATQNL